MSDKDSWQTPQDLYDYLNTNYGPFFWDACCTEENCKSKSIAYGFPNYDYFLKSFFELRNRGDLKNKAIFMNPPYSNPGPFIKKAWKDSLYFKVVILVPVSILSCKYLDFLDEPSLYKLERNWKPGVTIIPLRRRTKFEHATLKASSPPGGCMLLILERGKYANI